MIRLATAVAFVALATFPALGHHGYETYDQSRLMWVEGTLEEFRYQEPHATLRVRDAQGRVFEGEWQTVSQLTSMDIGVDALRRGERMLIVGNPQRDATILKVHLKAVRRLADGWHWPRCASTNGPYDCVVPTGPYGTGREQLIFPNPD